MTNETVLARLDGTGIPREEDLAVPINGKTRKLPYMVVRTKATVNGADLGRVRFMNTEWIVALFATNRDNALEDSIIKALASVGNVEIERFPDGQLYQTNFEFTTKQTMK